MLRTIRYALWGLVVLASLGLGALFLLPAQDQAGYGEPFGGPFALVDHNGEPISEAAFRGHPTLVFFGFTQCPEVCPTTLYEMDGWLAALGDEGRPIRAYFVTVDPQRDTPEVLRDYVTSVSNRVTGITGAANDIAAYLKTAGIYARRTPIEGGDYTMDHTASVFMLDRNSGLFGTIAYGEAAEQAVAKLRRLARS